MSGCNADGLSLARICPSGHESLVIYFSFLFTTIRRDPSPLLFQSASSRELQRLYFVADGLNFPG